MRLTWYGHAAFLLEGKKDAGEPVRIGLDPYRAPDVGTYAPIDDHADLVAISHENAKYHSFVETFHESSGKPSPVVDGLTLLQAGGGPQLFEGVSFTAVGVWENDKREEPIAMVGVTLEGVRFLHMGDVGHALSLEEVAACRTVDVLLALAGAGPTIALPDLVAFIGDLRPRIVIPMHFLNEKINLNLRPVEELLAFYAPEQIRRFSSPTVEITSDTLPPVGTTQIWLLPPCALRALRATIYERLAANRKQTKT